MKFPDFNTLTQLFCEGDTVDTKIISLYIEILVRDQNVHCCLRFDKETNEPRVKLIPSESLFWSRDFAVTPNTITQQVQGKKEECTKSGAAAVSFTRSLH